MNDTIVVHIEINKCEDCPHCEFDNNDIPERYGKYYCLILKKIVLDNVIDEHCPFKYKEDK